MSSLLGVLLVLLSILNAYLASNFKRTNYIFGLLGYLLIGYVAYKNNLYGMFISYLVIFSPMQLFGFFNWGKKQDKDKNVIVRALSMKDRFLLLTACIVFSLVLATLLNKIPKAQFTFLDSFSNTINLSAVILMSLRFNESWWLWLINNVLDLILWANVLKINGEYSLFMLISSIIYLVINVYGMIKWDKKIKEEASNILKIGTEKEVVIIAYVANIISLACYFIINSKVAIFVSLFEIIQLVINKFFKGYKIILTIFYYCISFIGCILLKPSNVEMLIILELLLFSLLPVIKKDKHIRIIGLINIIIFIIYDIYIKLYNLVFLDIFIIIVFVYGIYINDIISNHNKSSKDLV